MMGGCGEHASGTAAHSQGRSRLSREGRGSGRVRESRGARRARGKVGLYFITGIKETQNGTRAARTRARISTSIIDVYELAIRNGRSAL